MERRHVLHHLKSTDEDEEFAISDLISILDPVSRDVDDGPVEESLGKNSLDVDVDDDHRIESALLCRPHKTWPFLGERLVNSGLYEVLVKMSLVDLALTCIRPTPTLSLRSTLMFEGHSTNTFTGKNIETLYFNVGLSCLPTRLCVITHLYLTKKYL